MTKKNQAEKIKKLPEACEGCEHSIRPEDCEECQTCDFELIPPSNYKGHSCDLCNCEKDAVVVELPVSNSHPNTCTADKIKTEIRDLVCDLTDDEQRMRGVQVAKLTDEVSDLESQKKEISARISEANAKIENLLRAIKYKREERPVLCRLEPIWERKEMRIVRDDTGATVNLRPMTPSEQQQDLPGLEG